MANTVFPRHNEFVLPSRAHAEGALGVVIENNHETMGPLEAEVMRLAAQVSAAMQGRAAAVFLP